MSTVQIGRSHSQSVNSVMRLGGFTEIAEFIKQTLGSSVLCVYKHRGVLETFCGPICSRPDHPAIRPEKATVATESSGAALTTSAACLNALECYGG